MIIDNPFWDIFTFYNTCKSNEYFLKYKEIDSVLYTFPIQTYDWNVTCHDYYKYNVNV